MPQRFLRPAIRTSARWNTVSHAAARLYISLLTQVDDYGRYDGRTSVLWADAFAVWNDMNPDLQVTPQETAGFCGELAEANLVDFYESDGKRYVQLTQWQERARGNSKWPDPKKCEILPNPAESCRILPPSPLVIAISHKPSSTPSPDVRVIAKAIHAVADSALVSSNIHDFDAFWKAYPRKQKMGEAQRVWADMIDRPDIEILIAAIDKQKTTDLWKDENGRFIPNPSNWLGDKRWLDDGTTNSGIKFNGTHQQKPTESSRNIGTANEGRGHLYANVGKVKPATNGLSNP